jgi:UDP-N-acetylmuramoyl-tripeptide--D-alanyl-D-alanine ligase
VRVVTGVIDVEAALDAGEAVDLGGVLIIDGSGARGPEDLLRQLRVLAGLQRAGRRSVAVVGPVEGADWEEHDRIGRVVVRLDIRQLVVVGDGARHLASAAGLEGSWDGESVLVADTDGAYDVLRADIREGDVVLVTLPEPESRSLIERIGVAVA